MKLLYISFWICAIHLQLTKENNTNIYFIYRSLLKEIKSTELNKYKIINSYQLLLRNTSNKYYLLLGNTSNYYYVLFENTSNKRINSYKNSYATDSNTIPCCIVLPATLKEKMESF